MASVKITFTHPAMTVEETLTVSTDSKLVEFADFMIAEFTANGVVPSREEALQQLAQRVLGSFVSSYREYKRREYQNQQPDDQLDNDTA